MTDQSAIHESLSREETAKGSSDRSFGVVFTVVFAIIGLWPLIGGGMVRIWALVIGAIFLGLALACPRALAPLNRLWTKFGLLLHHITNPLIMGIVFFLAVTPTALIMKLLGKDPLKLRLDRGARSYWVERKPPGPAPESMRDQF